MPIDYDDLFATQKGESRMPSLKQHFFTRAFLDADLERRYQRGRFRYWKVQMFKTANDDDRCHHLPNDRGRLQAPIAPSLLHSIVLQLPRLVQRVRLPATIRSSSTISRSSLSLSPASSSAKYLACSPWTTSPSFRRKLDDGHHVHCHGSQPLLFVGARCFTFQCEQHMGNPKQL